MLDAFVSKCMLKKPSYSFVKKNKNTIKQKKIKKVETIFWLDQCRMAGNLYYNGAEIRVVDKFV